MGRDGPFKATPAEKDGSRRRLVVPRKRAAGLLALVVLPVVALSGLTTMRAEAGEAAAGLALSVDYPRVLRYLEPARIRVAVTNVGTDALGGARVTLARDYLDAFTELTLMPAESWVGQEGMVVEFDEIPAGETRFIRIELRGNQYWWHPGEVSATAPGAHVSVQVGTLVLP